MRILPVAVCLFLLFTQPGKAQWQAQPSGVTVTLHGIAFYNISIGYAVGDAGTVLKTTNGGDKWTSLPFPDKSNLISLTIIDSSALVVTTSNNKGSAAVYQSHDGGLHWFRALSDAAPFYATAAPGNQLYSVSSHIYSSTNLGKTWQPQQSLNPTSTYTQVSFSSRSTGMVAGNIAGILTYSADFQRTINGRDWYSGNQLSFPNANAFSRFSALGDDSVLVFTNRYNGFMPGDSSQLILLHHFRLRNYFGSPVWFFSNTVLIKSFPGIVSDCTFFHDGTGYAITEQGAICQLSKAQNITREYSSKTPLRAICMLSKTTGFAVGDNGLILKRKPSTVSGAPIAVVPLSIYPNPAASQTQVTFSLPQPARAFVQVANQAGNVLLRTPARMFAKGANVIQLPVSNLSRGHYSISLMADNKQAQGAASLLVVH